MPSMLPLLTLGDALQIVEDLRKGRPAEPFDDRINRSSTTLRVYARDIDVEVSSRLAAAGHRVRIRAEKGAWVGILEASGSSAFVIQASGPPEEAFDDENTILAVNDAVTTGDAGRLLALGGDIQCAMHIELLNHPDATGYDWYRTTEVFERALVSNGWLTEITRLCRSTGPRRIVLQDAERASLEAVGLAVHGPETTPRAVMFRPDEHAQAFRATRLTGERQNAPEPRELIVVDRSGLNALAPLFAGALGQLSWCWMADEVRLGVDGVIAVYRGARVIELPLTVEPATEFSSILELWQWAIASTDVGRFEALQQAISLAVATRADLSGAARPVLRTARSLYDLSQRGAVAEALATRRSAREAAFRAANSAADAARSAGGKAFDRVIVTALAILGVIVAQKTTLINTDVTRGVLYAIAVTLVVLLLGLLLIEFPSARSGLQTFEDDLQQYRDTLSNDDIAGIKQLKSIASARSTLARTELVSALMIIMVVVATLIIDAQI
jgi:hypothetical protein